RTVTVWNVATGKPVRLSGKWPAGPVLGLAYSPEGDTLAAATGAGAVCLYSLETGGEVARLKGHSDAVWAVAYSPDGKTLATGSADHAIKLWDAGTGKLRTTLRGHNGEVFALAFAKDGRTLASAGGDLFDPTKPGEVKLWDLSRNKV